MWFLKPGTHQADANELVETKADCGVVAILCGQSVIIRFYTSHFGNGTARLEPQVRWYRKKYQVLYPVENLSKVSRTKPYHTMQWKSPICITIVFAYIEIALRLLCRL